jgi:hypothetical protein
MAFTCRDTNHSLEFNFRRQGGHIYIYIYIFLAKNTIFKLFKNSILQDRYASIEDGRIEIIYYKSEKQVYSFKLIRIIF